MTSRTFVFVALVACSVAFLSASFTCVDAVRGNTNSAQIMMTPSASPCSNEMEGCKTHTTTEIKIDGVGKGEDIVNWEDKKTPVAASSPSKSADEETLRPNTETKKNSKNRHHHHHHHRKNSTVDENAAGSSGDGNSTESSEASSEENKTPLTPQQKEIKKLEDKLKDTADVEAVTSSLHITWNQVHHMKPLQPLKIKPIATEADLKEQKDSAGLSEDDLTLPKVLPDDVLNMEDPDDADQ